MQGISTVRATVTLLPFSYHKLTVLTSFWLVLYFNQCKRVATHLHLQVILPNVKLLEQEPEA